MTRRFSETVTSHDIMLGTISININITQGREARDRIEEGRGEATKSKRPQRSWRRNVGNGGGETWSGREKKGT